MANITTDSSAKHTWWKDQFWFTLPWDSCWKKGTPSSNWALKWIQMVDLLLLCSFYKMVSILGLQGTLIFHLLTAVCRLTGPSQTWASWTSHWGGFLRQLVGKWGYHVFTLQDQFSLHLSCYNLVLWWEASYDIIQGTRFKRCKKPVIFHGFCPMAGAAGLLRWLLWFLAVK